MDGHKARIELANSFAKILDELDEHHVTNPVAIIYLRDRVAEAFAAWRADTGYEMGGRGAKRSESPP